MARFRRQAKNAEELRRKPASRPVPDRILIVTEGSKTEPSYFRMLIAELKLTTAQVSIVGNGGSAPISVVDEAESKLQLDDDFEQVYCVFDKDAHTTYKNALEKIIRISGRKTFKSKVIKAIPSVSCFEMWYLLHVSESRKPYKNPVSPSDALIAELRQKEPFKDYKKAECQPFFDKISHLRSDASRRAARFIEEAQREGADEFHENPSTRVHLVVKALEEVAKLRKE